MNLKLAIFLHSILLSSTLSASEWFAILEPRPDSFDVNQATGALSDSAQRLLRAINQNSQQASTSSISRSSSSTSAESAQNNYSPQFQINHLGITYDMPIRNQLTEANLISLSAQIGRQQIGVRLSRAYSMDNGVLPTSTLTIDQLKLLAKHFPTLRGLDLQDTGLNLAMIKVMVEENLFPMLEWLNLSWNNLGEEELKLIFNPSFAPFLQHLEIQGITIDTDKTYELMQRSDEARNQISNSRWQRIAALDLAENRKMANYFSHSIVSDHFGLMPENTRLQDRLTIIFSRENFIIPYPKLRKNGMHQERLLHVLSKTGKL